jgi:hypothetical protein
MRNKISKHKFKVGDRLWYAQQFGVNEVTVLEQTTFIDGHLTYKVKYNDDLLSKQEEVFENYLYKRKLDALNDALRQNDISQTVVNNNIRNEVAFSDRLQASSQHMRKLLYEEQIVEYMKNKRPKQGD